MHRFILTRTAPALAVGAALGLAVAAPAEAKPAPSPVRCASPAAAGDKPVVVPLPGGGKLYIFDRDGDNRADGIVLDADGDGKMDAAASDCDRDGEFETHWVDKNKDGVVDPAEVTRKKMRKDASVRVGDATCGTKVNLKRRGLRPRSVHLVCPTAAPQPESTPAGSTSADGSAAPAEQLTPRGATTPGGATTRDVTPTKPPATRAPIEFGADIDGDRELEVLEGDTALMPNQSSAARVDDDRDADLVVVGFAGGAAATSTANVDNDPKDEEIIVEDPNLPANQSYGIDLDRDGDHDIIVIGTKGRGKVRQTANVDNDPNDTEIIVEDPGLPANQSYGIDLDGDGDHDVIVVGTKK